jgi:glycine/D-amino acid oxidase-like deaminating enzyme
LWPGLSHECGRNHRSFPRSTPLDLKSGYPFWPVNDGLIATYPRPSTDIRCDVAILGGGITGALVAHHLVDAGFDTVVIDRRDIAWGSTAASTALLQYEIDVLLTELADRYDQRFAARAYLACLEAIGKLEALADGCTIDTGFRRKKSLYLGTRKRDRRTLRDEYEARRAIGIRVDWLEEDDIAERFSFRRPAALLSADAAQVDAYAFAHGLIADAVRRGLRVFDRSAILDVAARADGVTLTSVEHCRIEARHVVFAAGYETRDFLAPKVAELVSTFAIASEPMPELPGWNEDRCVIWEHARPYLYLRTTPDNRVFVGGEDEPFRDPARRDRALPKKAERLAERFRELFPDIDLHVEFSWAGTFGETKDGLAYIGAHDDWPSAYFALGYGGNGITYSLIAAEIIRDALLGRTHPCADLFSFSR